MKKEITVAPKMYDAVVGDASVVGFVQVFVNNIYPKRVFCDRCKKYEALVFKASKDSLTPYHTAVACPCGWRKFIGSDAKKSNKGSASVKSPKKQIKVKPVCATEGCRAVLKSADENGGFCYKCRPVTAMSNPNPPARPVTNACKTKGCNYLLPPDRKSFCYVCRPKTQVKTDKEVASNQPTKIYV